MALTTTTIALIGLGVAAAGAVAEGQAKKADAEAQANIRRQQAASVLANAQLEARRQRRDESRRQASQRARLAASGVDVGSGTALLVQQQTAADAEFEALLTEAQGGRDAGRLRQEASALEKRGRNAAIGGFLNAGGSFLSGFSSFR